ncbi:hypothetical protein HK101_005914 [Irineochytrium annulatum]|nr:hypothetical protein HK101_005914 [Irineochytrium annulatum]
MIGSMQQQPVLTEMQVGQGGGSAGADLDPDLFQTQKSQAGGQSGEHGMSPDGHGTATDAPAGDVADHGGEEEDGGDGDDGPKKKRRKKGTSSTKKKSGSRSKGSKAKSDTDAALSAIAKTLLLPTQTPTDDHQTEDEDGNATTANVNGEASAASPATDSAASAAAVLAVSEANQHQQPNFHQLALQQGDPQGLVLHYPMANVNMTPADILAAYQLHAQQNAQFGYGQQFFHPGFQQDGNSTLDSLAAAAIAASLGNGGAPPDAQQQAMSMTPFQMMHMQLHTNDTRLAAEQQQQLQQHYQQQLVQLQQQAAGAPTGAVQAVAKATDDNGDSTAAGGTKKPRLRTFKYTAPHGEGETFHMGPRDTTCCVQCKHLGIGGEKICDHDMKRVFCKQCKALGIGGQHICEHDKKRDECRTCKALGVGGGKICDHDKWKDKCRECRALGIGGNSFCQHEKRRDDCKECKSLGIGGGNICDHGKMRYKCQTCKSLGVGGRGLCPHNLKRTACFQCIAMGFGSGYPMCEHNAKRAKCRQCKAMGTGGEAICDHNKVRALCKECKKAGDVEDEAGSSGVTMNVDLASVCEHGLIKGNCPTCLTTFANQGGEETEDEPEVDVTLFLRPTAKRKHKLLRTETHPIKRTRVCPHGYLKRDCSDCNATNLATGATHVCEHGMIRGVCPTCQSNPTAYQPPPPPPPSFDMKALSNRGYRHGDDEEDDEGHDDAESAAHDATHHHMNAPGARCEHDRQRNFCTDCLQTGRGGIHVCSHGIARYQCAECRSHLGWGSGGKAGGGIDGSDGNRLMDAAREMVEAINGAASVGGGHVLVTSEGTNGGGVCVHGKVAECEECASAVLGMYLNIAGSGVASPVEHGSPKAPAISSSKGKKKEKESKEALCPHGKGPGKRCRDCVMSRRSK